MRNADRAEQIAAKVRDLEERLAEWKALATENLPEREIARLNRLVEDGIAVGRAPYEHRERIAQVAKVFQSATDDGSLIQRLYEEIFLRSTV